MTFMEEKKYQFINWISLKKLKKITPKQFADLMEDAFSFYLGKDVWSVDAKEFAVLRDRLLANKNFKKEHKKTYKLLTLYSKYYFLFLSRVSDEQNDEAQSFYVKVKKDVDTGVEKYKDEYDRCLDFFQNKDTAHHFYHIYEYAKDKDSEIILDVRNTIIGVKKANERLRFYSNKMGIMKFAKIEVEPIDLSLVSASGVVKYYQYVDAVNAYFFANKQEVLLKNHEESYVFHKSFGFGKIIKKEQKTIVVQFDGQPTPKILQLGHPSYVEICNEDYLHKHIPDLSNHKDEKIFPSIEPQKIVPKRIMWDKYETVLLIEAFWEIEKDKTCRSRVIEQLSHDLRAKAINQGIEIDDMFRNINGISIQMANIAGSFFPDRASMHKTVIFDEMAKVYLENRQRYESILREAHALVRGTSQLPKTESLEKHKESESKVICPNDLRELLIKKFPYGIRPDSPIDIMKLRNSAEILGVVLSKDDELLKKQLAVGGDAFDGKIYFITEDTLEEMERRVRDIFDMGVCVIYYDKLYDCDFTWFDEHHIASSDHVRELLKRHMENVFCSKNFIRIGAERVSELEAVEGEFKRVWGECVTHTYNELYDLLPYIPDDRVRAYLSRSYFFVWSSFETFAWLERIIISDEEKDKIWKYVESMCESAGYASISEVPLGNVAEENYEISINAIYDAIYRVVLANHFQINGKILTRKDKETDALTLTKAFCMDKDECSFSDLNDYVISITGTSGRQIAFRAAYDQMVRTTKEKFVSDDMIHFDIDAIDALLDKFIQGDFVSIKGIATFVMFPVCGYTWNHYILESFCYRFSRKYRLEVINFNDKNAGIIVKKDCALSYSDILVSAVVHAGIALTEENVGKYLCDNGYTSKSKMAVLIEVTEKAQEQRRRGE